MAAAIGFLACHLPEAVCSWIGSLKFHVAMPMQRHRCRMG